MKQIDKIRKQLESVGLTVIHENDGIHTLVVKRKPKSKKVMFYLVFTKKGKLEYLLAGLKETNVTWIDIKQ